MLGKDLDVPISLRASEVLSDLLIVTQVRVLGESISTAIEGTRGLSVVGLAMDLAEAQAVLRAHPAVTILIDAAFPRGLEAIRALRDADAAARIIVFALAETEDNIVAWVKGGVTGYIPSSASVQVIPQYVEAILRGEQICSGAVASGLMRRIRTSISPVDNPYAARFAAALSSRENEIVKMIAAGLSNKEIARRLNIEVSTTKSHVHNLLSKLGLQSRGQVAYWARQQDGQHA